MPMLFSVKGFRRFEPVSVRLQAASAQEAREVAAAQGVAVHTVTAAPWVPWVHWVDRPTGPRFALLPFTQSLVILLEAGLPLVEAIETLAERESRGASRRLLAAVADGLRDGLPLSAALERQEKAAFPPLYVAMVRANERTGALAEAMQRYVAYQAQIELVRKRVIGASIYPALILVVGALVIGFLLAYVVPRFAQVFQDMGERVPYLSRVLLAWGNFAYEHAAALVTLVVLALCAIAFALTRASVRVALMRAVQHIPRVGQILRTYQLARFYRALGMLQQAGIPIVTALQMMQGLLPAAWHGALERARTDVANGRALSTALETHGLSTVVALRLLRVAEQTGRMGELLQRCASFHDDEVAQSIEWFVRLFEPLLMVAIGIVIGIVVLLMYAPIFEMAGSLQ